MSRVRLVWNLFDNVSSLGKAILRKLLVVIDLHTERKGLPPFCGMAKEETNVEEDLREAVKPTLKEMVVGGWNAWVLTRLREVIEWEDKLMSL